MDYKGLTDEEMVDLYQNGNEGVMDYILNKYKNMVRGKASSMFIIGGERDDLIQEGMIGLFKAVKGYDMSGESSFATFAQLCVSRQMYTAIQSAGRQKHNPLNTYISIYEEDFQKEGGVNPEDAFLDNERVEVIEEQIDKVLSNLEKQVLELKVAGLDYQEIAGILGKTPKSMDNAIQRIKMKIKKILVAGKDK